LMQQMNIDADRLANEYIQRHPDENYSIVPILPTSGVQLNIPDGTVTHKLKRTIMQARPKREHHEYLCKANSWTSDTFNMIDWESHRQALNRLPKHRTILIKFLNNMAPVGKLVHRYNPKYPTQCPSCPEQVETQEHMLVCPCPKRQAWRETFLTKIEDTLAEYKTPLEIKMLMLDGIRYSLGEIQEMPSNGGFAMTCIESQQATIGWKQLLKGRITQEWKKIQQETMLGHETKHRNAQTWATTIIQTIFEHVLQLWKIRNEDRHGRDWQTTRKAAKEQVVRELEQLYAYKGQVLPEHEWIFHSALDQQKQKSTYILRAFVNNYQPVILASYQTRLETG
jgi:transcriptional regulator of met regulon